MKKWMLLFLTAMFCASFALAQDAGFRRLSISEYRDKMKGGWVGQIAGVVWGAPTEFKWVDKIIPEAEMPVWTPEMINNAFGQDDLYVEMTFLRTLEQYGIDASIRQAGIDFANSRYSLWCANRAGRNNLRSGIAPPDSGHPMYNKCPNDIDYQIEADYSGLISPGMPNNVVTLGEKFGRLMNYGDGIYGGIFMGAMYTEAFFTKDLNQILDAGYAAIPAESQYAEMVRDLRKWHAENPNDWTVTWNKCLEKYRKNPEYQKASNGAIDVKINGACILLGLLYGNGDFDETIKIAARAGYDSDCNPSSAAGVLFASVGFENLPARFSEKLNNDAKFSYTEYNFPSLLDVCEKLARESVAAAGGRMEIVDGIEYFVIPVQKTVPMELELSWDPKPAQNVRFTEEEMKRIEILHYGEKNIQSGIDKFYPGWKISQCGPDMNPRIEESFGGKENVLKTHPLDSGTPCVLSRSYAVPKTGKTTLELTVRNHPKYDWELVIRVNGSVQFKKTIDGDAWQNVSFDLTPFAGNTVQLELENRPDEWMCEAGYWSRIEILNEE